MTKIQKLVRIACFAGMLSGIIFLSQQIHFFNYWKLDHIETTTKEHRTVLTITLSQINQAILHSFHNQKVHVVISIHNPFCPN